MPLCPWPIRWLLLLLLLVPCTCARASTPARTLLPNHVPYAIDIWENDDGLPQNEVLSIVQTSDGYLWLGTLSGLVRFDGLRFSVHDPINTPDLPSSRIVHVFEDSNHDLWVGTETAGASVVRQGRILRLDLDQATRENRLVASCEDLDGAVWLLAANGSLARIRSQTNGETTRTTAKTKGDIWTLPGARPESPPSLSLETNGTLLIAIESTLHRIQPRTVQSGSELPAQTLHLPGRIDSIVASRSGGHWRLVNGRIERWDQDQRTLDFGNYPWDRTPIGTACEDPDGNLVVGTLGAGLYWFDSNGRSVQVAAEQGLSSSYILALTFDREGSLWIGTDGGGLNRIRPQVFSTLPPTRGQVVQTVAAEPSGALWVGYNGGGADRWTPTNTQHFGAAEGLPDRLSIRSIHVSTNHRVLVGTLGAGLLQLENGRFRRAPGSESLHPVVTALLQDRAGALWIGTRGGLGRLDAFGFTNFTTRHGLPSDHIQALAYDSAGALWVGTADAGLARIANGTVAVLAQENGLPPAGVAALHIDRHGSLWVGTHGAGIARFHNGAWTRLTTGQGLLSNSIGYFLEDEEDQLWMGTIGGLLRLPLNTPHTSLQPGSLTVRSYSRRDGLPSGECSLGSQPAACRTLDGRLCFATIKGLALASPERLKPNPHQPPVVIESILVDSQLQGSQGIRAPHPGNLLIPPNPEHVEIHYTSLNLASPDRARFRYRLDGHEDTWTEAGSDRVARYTKLPPGRYTFLVTASNEDGLWNPTPASFTLTIAPPFWRTAWFLIPASLTSLALIVGAVHLASTRRLQRQLEHMRQHEVLEQERARIARDLHDQLGANLTQVALLGEMAQADRDLPQEVDGHARQIVQTARETTRALDEIVWTVNPSNDTLEGLANYACKYAQDYFTLAGLRYRLDVPPALPDVTIPPEVRHNLFLAFKEAVNNVVKHAQASCAFVRLHLHDTTFAFEITDDGRGPADIASEAARTRNGLRNMQRRMQDVGGSFSISPAPDRGTRVTLSAPLPRT